MGFFIARVSARKAREEVGETWGATSEPLGVFLLRFHLKSDPLFIPKGEVISQSSQLAQWFVFLFS